MLSAVSRFYHFLSLNANLWMQAFRKSQEPAVYKLKEPILDEITATLVSRYELNFTRQTLLLYGFSEASLLDITDQACGLFSPSEVALLEWTDDLEMFILKGYGKSINYRMGVPLLKDVVHSMEQALRHKKSRALFLLHSVRLEQLAPGSYERQDYGLHMQRRWFLSHVYLVFSLNDQNLKIQREQPLELPPRPPHSRNWWGSMVAPFAGNNLLVLHSCPANPSSKYFIQVLHNERPITMPGCNNSDFCPFEEFKEMIVAPHLKHDYNTICTKKLEQPEQKFETSKLLLLFHWLFSLGRDETESTKADL
ncbi:hypothetical protein GH714_037298 [Hevea brasiliensis]|uniref:Multiple inositol polyphosphate phosphatase 1 n=1 Tax=Hevea brasiliensis TaxID=3981 RepID=A0A6A6L7P7_HEVBR|nr:hypothetical protein GH714_037298 [Hevea brasiliensis]